MPRNYLLEVTWTDKWLVYLTGALVFFTAALCLVTLFIALKANKWAHRYWQKQKKEEINYNLESIRYKSQMEAAKAAWGLLAFLTEKENGRNLLIYKGTKDNPEIFFSLDRAREYLKSLDDTFYFQGHGIFLTKEIKQFIFHVRTNVYRILDKEQRRGIAQGEVLMENPEAVKFFRESFENLRSKLDKYIKVDLKYEIEE